MVAVETVNEHLPKRKPALRPRLPKGVKLAPTLWVSAHVPTSAPCHYDATPSWKRISHVEDGWCTLWCCTLGYCCYHRCLGCAKFSHSSDGSQGYAWGYTVSYTRYHTLSMNLSPNPIIYFLLSLYCSRASLSLVVPCYNHSSEFVLIDLSLRMC